MPLAISRQEQIGAPPSLLRRRPWSRKDRDVLESTGAFESQHYELIKGELIDRMGMNPQHRAIVSLIAGWLFRVFGSLVHVTGQIDVSPKDTPTSAPEPDVYVTSAPAEQFWRREIGPGDLLLVIEAADSTLAFDTVVKAGLYARAGIADYWVFDIVSRRIIVHRDPSGGTYGSVIAYEYGESVAPLAAPRATIRWTDLIPEHLAGDGQEEVEVRPVK